MLGGRISVMEFKNAQAPGPLIGQTKKKQLWPQREWHAPNSRAS
jgi:hypothetical protein